LEFTGKVTTAESLGRILQQAPLVRGLSQRELAEHSGTRIGTLRGDQRTFDLEFERDAVRTFGIDSSVSSVAVPLAAVPTRAHKQERRYYFQELLPEGRMLKVLAQEAARPGATPSACSAIRLASGNPTSKTTPSGSTDNWITSRSTAATASISLSIRPRRSMSNVGRPTGASQTLSSSASRYGRITRSTRQMRAYSRRAPTSRHPSRGLNAGLERIRRETVHRQRRVIELRRVHSPGQRDPDRVGNLDRETMEGKSRHQAHHRPRNPQGNHRQIRVADGRQLCQPVDAAADPLEHPLIHYLVEPIARHPSRQRLAHPHLATVLLEYRHGVDHSHVQTETLHMLTSIGPL